MSTVAHLTLAEYDRMIECGVFDPSRTRGIELIYGEIREMSLPNPPHEDVIDLLTEWSTQSKTQDVRLRVQNSIGLPALESAPQPDIAWVRARSYRTARPQPDDVLLVIEVSHSTLGYDRGEKAGLYARAGVEDYWVVNVEERRVEVFRSPEGDTYREKRSAGPAESVTPLALPEVALPVSMLFSE